MIFPQNFSDSMNQAGEENINVEQKKEAEIHPHKVKWELGCINDTTVPERSRVLDSLRQCRPNMPSLTAPHSDFEVM